MTFVHDVIYLQNPLDWDEDKNGIYFQWGQKYKGFYLPNQIKKINSENKKIKVLDKLVCHEVGLISNLWRMPEGLVYKIVCDEIVV